MAITKRTLKHTIASRLGIFYDHEIGDQHLGQYNSHTHKSKIFQKFDKKFQLRFAHSSFSQIWCVF